MALVGVEGVFYATVLVGGTRQATAATKWASIPACSGIRLPTPIIQVHAWHLRIRLPPRYTPAHAWHLGVRLSPRCPHPT
jgi:hypothetical protein